MNGFIDIHTHLLPGIDDGAADLKEALSLARLAWQDGTRTIILTPHYRGKYKKKTVPILQEAFAAFCEAAKKELPELTFYLGQEIYFEAEAPAAAAAGKILSLNGSEYVLLEFRPSVLRSRVIAGVSEMLRYGFTPIIAHAERYDIFRKDAALVNEVLDMGALIQLSADGILGKQGFGVKRFCHKMLKTGRAHFVASDAHDHHHRTPLLKACFAKVQKKYGADYAALLFHDNGQAVINNEII